MHISTAHSRVNAFVSLPIIKGRQKKKRKGKINNKAKAHTLQSDGGETVLGFQWVDWRGFGPLNRSTCSAGISRK